MSRHAQTPPMGWNSWDSYGTTVTQDEVLANATVLAERLLPHGWDTVVVDIDWYDPAARAHGYNDGSSLALDAFGRQLPAENRFPSAAGGRGFGPLADAVHALGLRFGVHLMRGIPRIAVERTSPSRAPPGPPATPPTPPRSARGTRTTTGSTTTTPPRRRTSTAWSRSSPAGASTSSRSTTCSRPTTRTRSRRGRGRSSARAGTSSCRCRPGTHLSTAHVDHLREHAQMWRDLRRPLGPLGGRARAVRAARPVGAVPAPRRLGRRRHAAARPDRPARRARRRPATAGSRPTSSARSSRSG